MKIESFRTPGLGDQTYLFSHEGVGVLVDPQRDVERFLSAAGSQGLDLQYVLETHLHNDYVSGGVEAARRTGAELVMPAAAAPAYDHRPAFHMEDIPGEGFTIRPLHTPGHTPEHTSYVVLMDGEPVAVFSGGSLLVASAGRPDLLGMARARSLGKLQYISINRIAALPDHVELFPTHGEGSFCAAGVAGRFTSTVGEERAFNPLLRIADAESMADALLASPMPIPAFYKYMGPANTLGSPDMPPLDVAMMSVPVLQTLPATTRVIDIRPRAEQAEGFLPGSLTIELSDDFGSWAAWLTDHDSPVVLVAGSAAAAREAVTQLAQVGVDDVRGIVSDLSGVALSTFVLQDLSAFQAGLGDHSQLLDVRMPNERLALPLPGAHERFVADLVADGLPDGIDPTRPVHIVCGSGRRGAIAASVLDRLGVAAVVLDAAGVADLVHTTIAA